MKRYKLNARGKVNAGIAGIVFTLLSFYVIAAAMFAL